MNHIERRNYSEQLETYCPQFGIELGQEQIDALLKHLELVIERNRVVNLTRIDSFEGGLILHLLDSLLAYKCIEDSISSSSHPSNDHRFLDMGTGAGFPGIPFAIASCLPGTLVDSVGKKVQAVKEFCGMLGLSNVACVHDRLESLALESAGSFSIVLARAVAPIGVLIEYAAPFLKQDGLLVVMKAHPSVEELDYAKRAASICGLNCERFDSFELPLDMGHREIYIYRKVSKPRIKLPRAVGRARHDPLA